MPVSPCFSYPADAPPGNENGNASRRPRPGVRRMPVTCYGYPNMCFSYPGDVPQGGGDRGVVQPSLSDVRRMPGGTCFRY